jgi:hypothetical protein
LLASLEGVGVDVGVEAASTGYPPVHRALQPRSTPEGSSQMSRMLTIVVKASIGGGALNKKVIVLRR